MTAASPELKERAARVRLIVLDSDGVLTDGRIVLCSDGSETRSFDVTDGFGIRIGQKAGLAFAIVSGRRSEVLARRAAELDIHELHQRILDKAGCVQGILERVGIPAEAACFVGDDLIDLPAMRIVGLAAAPANAQSAVQEMAHFVSGRDGGRGAVREVIELVLRSGGKWDDAVQRFVGPGG